VSSAQRAGTSKTVHFKGRDYTVRYGEDGTARSVKVHAKARNGAGGFVLRHVALTASVGLAVLATAEGSAR
jgi:hypothetical protein